MKSVVINNHAVQVYKLTIFDNISINEEEDEKLALNFSEAIEIEVIQEINIYDAARRILGFTSYKHSAEKIFEALDEYSKEFSIDYLSLSSALPKMVILNNKKNKMLVLECLVEEVDNENHSIKVVDSAKVLH